MKPLKFFKELAPVKEIESDITDVGECWFILGFKVSNNCVNLLAPERLKNSVFIKIIGSKALPKDWQKGDVPSTIDLSAVIVDPTLREGSVSARSGPILNMLKLPFKNL